MNFKIYIKEYMNTTNMDENSFYNPHFLCQYDDIYIEEVRILVEKEKEKERILVEKEKERILVEKEKEKEKERILVEKEKERILVEKERILVEKEKERILVEKEKEKILVEKEKERILVEKEKERILVEKEKEEILVEKEKKEKEEILVEKEGKVSRPPNCFMCFSNHYRSKNQKISTLMLGNLWKDLPDKEKKRWTIKSREKKRKHLEENPGYKYQPNKKGKSNNTGKKKRSFY